MSEFPQEDRESPFQGLAEAVVDMAQEVTAYRDFLGRKKAGLIIEDLGIDTSGDDELETVLTDVFGTCVTTGMILAARKKTDGTSIDTSVERLRSELPQPLLPSLGKLIPYLLNEGIKFQNEKPSDRIRQQWQAEFNLLRSLSKD